MGIEKPFQKDFQCAKSNKYIIYNLETFSERKKY